MLQYLFSTTIVWLVSLFVFDFFLAKENYHSYNRFYLLFTFLIGVLLPLWRNPQFLPGDTIAYPARWQQPVLVVYWAGVFVSVSLLMIDIVKMAVLYRLGGKTNSAAWTIVETGKEHSPFSYLDILFVSAKDVYTEHEWDMISAHEKRHAVLLHFADVLLMQIARIVFWFNPLVYLYNSRLLLVHEYQADKGSSPNEQAYGRFLLEQSMLQDTPSMAHSLGRSPIRSRIMMLAKNASQRTSVSMLKGMLILPLTVLCLFVFTNSGYSSKPAGETWKKQVARVIDLSQASDTVMHHLRDVSSDMTLLETMVNAIRAGKITAYSNADHSFSTKLTRTVLDELITPKVDTLVQTDPKSGKVISRMTRPEFDYGKVHKYRVLEEWTYNRETGRTEIETLGIAPIEEIYGDDGSFHGVRAMFYLRYNDVRPLLAHYELYHPGNTVSGHIWNDYFSAGEKK